MSDPRQTPRRPSKLVLDGVRPKRSWRVRLLMIGTFLALCGVTGAAVGVVTIYYLYSRGLPDIPRVDEYRPAVLSELLTDDGVLAAEFYAERRKVVPYDQIPKRIVQAFIASEDASFFDHSGVDVLGTARAAVNTLRKKFGLGGSVQGGSTLTQQTAKAILVTAETLDLDTEQMMAKAEKSVPLVTDPAPADVERELAAVQRELREAGFVRLSEGTLADSPTAE